MGKSGRNERRKIGATFLNGIGVATIAASCISPAIVSDARWWLMLAGAVTGTALHLAAIWLVSNTED